MTYITWDDDHTVHDDKENYIQVRSFLSKYTLKELQTYEEDIVSAEGYSPAVSQISDFVRQTCKTPTSFESLIDWT
jgi:hypothetical protein